MALTASLSVDITNFQAGLKRAEVSLQTFDRASKSMNRDLRRLLEDFSGQRVVAEAARMAEAVERVGGASRLTRDEQTRVNRTVEEAIAKYRALGQQAPQAMLDLASATRQAERPLISIGGLLQGVVAGATAAVTTSPPSPSSGRCRAAGRGGPPRCTTAGPC